MRRIARCRLCLWVAAMVACQPAEEAEQAKPKPAFVASADGLRWEDGATWVRLLPRARIGGQWRGGGVDGKCALAGQILRCPAGAGNVVAAGATPAGVALAWVELAGAATVEAIELGGEAQVDGASAWVSNGFQSWSQSGMLALGPPPSDAALAAALAVKADGEVIRQGSELSWWWTAVGGEKANIVAGVLDARRWKSWAQVTRADVSQPGRLGVRLVCGGAGERVRALPGGKVEGEAWFVAMGPDLQGLFDGFASRIASRRAAKPLPAELGWNSWYELWDGVDENAVRENAALAAQVLRPVLPKGAPPLRIVVDDGWQQGWGDWLPNAKFPSGLDGLAKDLKAKDFRMGVWLAPLLVAEKSPLATQHPEWLVQGAVYMHLKMGKMRVLDVTHPQAAAHLKEVIARIVHWGYDLLKIDFLFAGTFEGGRHEDVTGLQAYDRALELMREAAGPDTILLAVGAPPVPTLRHVDAWRVGGDIAVENFGVVWAFLPSQLRSIAARLPYCAATLCDADPAILRDLSEDEVEFGAWTVAIAGGAGFLSDDLRKLEPKRPGWAVGAGRAALWLAARPAVPLDFFPKEPPLTLVSALFDHLEASSRHVVPMVWRMQDGRDVAFNASDAERTVEVAPGRSVLVPAHAARVVP